MSLVYAELRRLAVRRLAHEKPGQTLQATPLVNEACLRLPQVSGQTWESKGHFFGAAAEAFGLSHTKADRTWLFAKAWLAQALKRI